MIQHLFLSRLSVDIHLHAPTGVFVPAKGFWNLINNLGDFNDIQAFSPECRHLNITSEQEFGFFCSAKSQFLVALHIYTVFDDNHLHSSWALDCQSRLLWLNPTLGMREGGIVPQQRPGCPTEAVETEDKDAAQHSQHTACFPTTVIPCGNTNAVTPRMDFKKKYSLHLI